MAWVDANTKLYFPEVLNIDVPIISNLGGSSVPHQTAHYKRNGVEYTDYRDGLGCMAVRNEWFAFNDNKPRVQYDLTNGRNGWGRRTDSGWGAGLDELVYLTFDKNPETYLQYAMFISMGAYWENEVEEETPTIPTKKFTRLYIGGAVASSGGKCFKRLSTETPIDTNTLVGTWVFNDTLDFSGVTSKFYFEAWNNINSVKANINVSSVETVKRENISMMEIRNTGWINCGFGYTNDEGGSVGGNFWIYGDGVWKQSFTTAEKTLVIPPPDEYIGDYESVTNYDKFFTWLKANATKVS